MEIEELLVKAEKSSRLNLICFLSAAALVATLLILVAKVIS